MATLDCAARVREFYRAFNEKDMERVRALMQPDAVMQSVPFGTTLDLVAHCQNWLTGFPDGKVELTNVVAQGDQAIAEFIGRGTNNGPLLGPGGARIPPTGRRCELRFIEVHQFRNGKMAGSRQYFDALSFMTQLGLGPQPLQAQQPAAFMPEARH
jgi:steroid delta-isomerase-like uncharacterized protein